MSKQQIGEKVDNVREIGTKPKYEVPQVKVLTEQEVLSAFQVTAAGTSMWWVCWIGAVVFEENLVTGPRVNLVRNWLVNEFEPSGLGAKLVMGLYRKYGQRVAGIVEKNSILKRGFRKLFDQALAKAEAKYGTI